jgi:hypothetical protein
VLPARAARAQDELGSSPLKCFTDRPLRGRRGEGTSRRLDLKHQSNWEPTVAVDPIDPSRVYHLITGINASACKGDCPGTSVLFRRSTDGGDVRP